MLYCNTKQDRNQLTHKVDGDSASRLRYANSWTLLQLDGSAHAARGSADPGESTVEMVALTNIYIASSSQLRVTNGRT